MSLMVSPNCLMAQNTQRTEPYLCLRTVGLSQGAIIKLHMQAGDVVDAYPSPSGTSWLKVIIEGQVYAAPMESFISESKFDRIKPSWNFHTKLASFSLTEYSKYEEALDKWEKYDNLRSKGKRYSKEKINYNSIAPTSRSNIRQDYLKPRFESSSVYNSNAEQAHWLKSNIDNGKYLSLEDGTMYEVEPGDRIDASLWLPFSSLIIIDEGGLYDYLIINTDDDEKVHAKKVVRK